MQSRDAISRLSQTEGKRFGVPDTVKWVSPFPFAGMNQEASRFGVQDNEAYWQENYIRLGDGNLRAVPDVGNALYTPSGKTIACFADYGIQGAKYFVVFHTDGTAVQVNAVTGAVTAIPGAFYVSGGAFPATVNWGSQYLLVANNNTPNDYWAWDGSLVYAAGGISPQITLSSGGLNYGTLPSVTVFGGTGSGVVLVPQIQGGSVVGLIATNPGSGYSPGDVVQAAFSGGGSDSSALLTAFLITSSVETIEVLAGGSGYTSAPAVAIAGFGGSGATATASIAGGKVVSITVTAGGSGYGSAPVVTLSGGGGSGAIAVASLNSQSVSGVVVVRGGSGFNGIPTITFVGGGGSGATGTAVMSGPGPIVTASVVTSGSGYTYIPTVTITDSTGFGAQIIPVMGGGTVASLTVVNGGTNYTNPTISMPAPGGTGTTATGTVAIGGGQINSVTITNGGGRYVTAPGVIVQPGANNAASVTLSLMPYGVSGSSMESYQSQVWLQYPFQQTSVYTGGVRLSSAVGSISNFATSAGGLGETNTDRFLRSHYTAIRQSNGYLYPLGGGSVNVISNVQVSGSPATKSLNNQNTDPQAGTGWRDTLQDFGRTVLFANPFGVYGLYGGAVTKISGKMDRIFANAQLPSPGQNPLVGNLVPSGAVADLYSQKVYLLLLTIQDPFTSAYRNACVAWNEKEFFIVSQSKKLTYIATQQIESQITAWGTDGASLFPLLTTFSNVLTKTWASKLYGAQNSYMTKQSDFFYMQAENLTGTRAAPTFNVTIDTEYASFANAVSPGILFPPAGFIVPPNATGGPSVAPLLGGKTLDIPAQQLGVTINSTHPNHAIYNLSLATEDIGAFWG
jgi:hypothetical protein